jgi:hypothetical protein
MAICVYESGNTTIRNQGELLENCPGYVMLEYADYQNIVLQQNTFLGLPDITPAEGGQLLSAYLGLFAIAVVWRRLRQVPS